MIVGRDPVKAGVVLDRLGGPGSDVVFEPCDAVERAELRDLVARVLGSHGRIDILVNGAGAKARASGSWHPV